MHGCECRLSPLVKLNGASGPVFVRQAPGVQTCYLVRGGGSIVVQFRGARLVSPTQAKRREPGASLRLRGPGDGAVQLEGFCVTGVRWRGPDGEEATSSVNSRVVVAVV